MPQNFGMSLTTDRDDPLLHETEPETGMRRSYLIMDEHERQHYVRPVRRSYRHERCGHITTMGIALAETYAAKPDFYGRTYCAACHDHFPVGANGEFWWVGPDGEDIREKVGT